MLDSSRGTSSALASNLFFPKVSIQWAFHHGFADHTVSPSSIDCGDENVEINHRRSHASSLLVHIDIQTNA
jgi:hypothetical protein